MLLREHNGSGLGNAGEKLDTDSNYLHHGEGRCRNNIESYNQQVESPSPYRPLAKLNRKSSDKKLQF